MSVVIRGMKMPKSCDECDLNYDCFRCILPIENSLLYGKDTENGRLPNCPLVELPEKHGRLGDLDAMAFDESEAYMSAQAKLGRDVITTGINSIVHRKIQLLIMDTPTIIEAEVME